MEEMPKKKRAPTAYNLFFGVEMKKLAQDYANNNKVFNFGEGAQIVGRLWQREKEKNAKAGLGGFSDGCNDAWNAKCEAKNKVCKTNATRRSCAMSVDEKKAHTKASGQKYQLKQKCAKLL